MTDEETEAQRDDVTWLQITQLVRGGAKVLSWVCLMTPERQRYVVEVTLASLTVYLGRSLTTPPLPAWMGA